MTKTVKQTNTINNKNIWRNDNMKKWKREKIKTKGKQTQRNKNLRVLLKIKQEFSKHEVRKFHFLNYKKFFFQTLEVTSWNVRKKYKFLKAFIKARNYKFKKYKFLKAYVKKDHKFKKYESRKLKNINLQKHI